MASGDVERDDGKPHRDERLANQCHSHEDEEKETFKSTKPE
jgi:hypothetical protein